MKICKKCKKEKEIINFHKNKRTKDGLNDYCKPCKSEYLKRNKYPRSTVGKICTKCKEMKPASDYTTSRTRTDGLQNKCKTCSFQFMQNRAQRGGLFSFLNKRLNDAKTRVKNYKKRGRNLRCNITINDLVRLYHKHSGLCAISGIKMTHVSYGTRGKYPFNISLDRIDSSKGYIEGNVQLVCCLVNHMKWDSDMDVFIDMCKRIAEKHCDAQV